MGKSKLNHGGAREGAGRKRMGEECRKSLTVRISPEALARLEERAKADGVSKGILIETLIFEKK